MIQRFKIEDLVIQDASGVVFKATDEETGLPVSVRRFFPFGADGGGLDDAMQADYNASVARLANVKHPALCSVIEGGCDPVDGMPYLVTEWLEGTLLIDFLKNRPLSQPEALALIMPIMEVCQLLSDAIGHDGVWVETDFGNITLGTGQAHRPVTFRISPVKCLGQSEQHRGLFPLVELTACIMGWHQGVPENLTASGLGAWLNWLHGACESASIREASEQLAIATGVKPPAPSVRKTRQVTGRMANTATNPLLATANKVQSKAAVPMWLVASLILASLGLGGWYFVHRNASAQAKMEPLPSLVIVKTAEPKAAETPPPLVTETVEQPPALEVTPAEPHEDEPNNPAPELAEIKQPAPPPAPAKVAVPPTGKRGRQPKPTTPTATAVKSTVPPAPPVTPPAVPPVKPPSPPAVAEFNAADQRILLGQKGKLAVVVGTVEEIAFSHSKETMYLVFSKNNGSSFRGAISVKIAKDDLSKPAMDALVGKKIRLTGMINVESPNRPVIMIDKRAAIQPGK